MRRMAVILTLLMATVASAQELREPATNRTGRGTETVLPSGEAASLPAESLAASEPEVSFGLDTNVVKIFDASGEVYRSAAPESKREIARRLLGLAAGRLSG